MTRITATRAACLLITLLPLHPRPDAVAQEAAEHPPLPLRVLSFNVRYNNPGDAINAWPNRSDRVAGLIRFYEPDVAGLQEVLVGQLHDLEQRLPDYTWVGVGRDDGMDAGEFSPIFYRPDRLELVETGTFWLSETPDSVGSRGWDAALPRIATWAVFLDRATGRRLHAFNTHFDHRGAEARLGSARLLRSRALRAAEGEPLLLTGDLNAEPGSPPIQALLECADPSGAKMCLHDSRMALHGSKMGTSGAYGPEGTMHGFAVTEESGRRIDYVLTSSHFAVVRQGHLTDSNAGFYPSDHIPVLADLVLVGDQE